MTTDQRNGRVRPERADDGAAPIPVPAPGSAEAHPESDARGARQTGQRRSGQLSVTSFTDDGDAPKSITLADLHRMAEEVYIYRNGAGEEVLLVARLPDKQFRQLTPSSDGHWVWGGTSGRTDLPLYNGDLLAADPTAPVYVVEGEKDADRLAAAFAGAGLPGITTTAPMGAGTAHLADWSPVAGLVVFVLPDHDRPGMAHAEDVARLALEAGATSVAIVPLPGEAMGDDLPKKHGRDLSDWFDDGGDVKELLAACADAKAYRSRPPDGFTSILDWSPPPATWLLWLDDEPIFEGGDAASLVIARDGIGKTTITMLLAAIMVGEGRKVVWCSGEDAGGVHRRAKAIARRLGIDLSNLLFYPKPVDLRDEGAATRFIDSLRVIAPDIVIIDPLADFLPGAEENSGAETTTMLALLSILRQAGIAFIIVHHTNAAGTRSRGHSSLEAACGGRFRITEKNGRFEFACEKQRNAPRASTRVFLIEGVELDELDAQGRPVWAPMAVQVECRQSGADGPRTIATLGEKARKALDYLKANGPLRATEWLKGAKLPPSTFYRLIAPTGELHSFVEKDENGAYFCIESTPMGVPRESVRAPSYGGGGDSYGSPIPVGVGSGSESFPPRACSCGGTGVETCDRCGADLSDAPAIDPFTGHAVEADAEEIL